MHAQNPSDLCPLSSLRTTTYPKSMSCYYPRSVTAIREISVNLSSPTSPSPDLSISPSLPHPLSYHYYITSCPGLETSVSMSFLTRNHSFFCRWTALLPRSPPCCKRGDRKDSGYGCRGRGRGIDAQSGMDRLSFKKAVRITPNALLQCISLSLDDTTYFSATTLESFLPLLPPPPLPLWPVILRHYCPCSGVKAKSLCCRGTFIREAAFSCANDFCPPMLQNLRTKRFRD